MSKTLQKQETVVAVSPDSVPFKSTTVGKTVRTFFQAIAGVVTILVLSPEFRDLITNNFPELALYLPLAVALFTAIQNGIDKTVKNF